MSERECQEFFALHDDTVHSGSTGISQAGPYADYGGPAESTEHGKEGQGQNTPHKECPDHRVQQLDAYKHATHCCGEPSG